MRVVNRFLLSCFLLVACAGPARQAPAARGAANPDTILATLDGIAIRRLDLDTALERELKGIDNEAEQRKFHLLWTGVDAVLNQTLLIREAERRGITVAALKDQEIARKATPPADDEVRAIYDANREVIHADFDVVAPYIRKQLSEDRRNELEQALIEELRRSADVRYAVPPPELPRFEVDAGSGPAWGPRDARVTVITFNDFECPYCARARKMIDKLKEAYPERLRVVFRDFPLEQHPNARRAAEAAQCAHEQQKFWPYHDLLFDNAKALSGSDLRRYAAEAKLDLAAFDTCVASERPRQAVLAHEQAGKRYGVEGTPAIFVNGMKLVGLLPLPLMKAIIERELSRN